MSSNQTAPTKKPSPSWKNLLICVVIAIFLRWQIIEPRWIPSGSMLPTLKIQDRILVEKVKPRLKRKQNKALKKGNIVIFHPPEKLVNVGYDYDSALIKRVVGTPGDLIAVHEGKLFRNGKSVQEIWLKQPINYEMDEIEVPKHQLWVLGDNRNNSLDSHIWGPLPEERVIGTAIWRYWPLTNFGPIRFPTQEND